MSVTNLFVVPPPPPENHFFALDLYWFSLYGLTPKLPLFVSVPADAADWDLCGHILRGQPLQRYRSLHQSLHTSYYHRQRRHCTKINKHLFGPMFLPMFRLYPTAGISHWDSIVEALWKVRLRKRLALHRH